MSIEYVDSYMDRHESNTETQDWYGEMVWALCMPMEQVKIYMDRHESNTETPDWYGEHL